jgi:hypothetical protein
MPPDRRIGFMYRQILREEKFPIAGMGRSIVLALP